MSGPPGADIPIDPERAEESNTEWLLGVLGTFCFVALVTVGARMYTRIHLVKAAGWDDYIMALAMLCSLGGMVCFSVQGFYGLGKHIETIDPADIRTFGKISFIHSIVCDIGALSPLKVSIALSLLRMCRSRWYRWALWALIVFVIAYGLMAWFTFIFYCDPVSGFWDKRSNPKCYDIKLFITFGLINTAFNIFTDVCFATLPIPIIWVLQMKLRTRVYLIAILSLGYVAVGFGIVKAVYQIGYGGNPDRQFLHSIQFWGYLQLNAGITAACAPTLRSLLGRALGLSTTDNSYGYGASGNHHLSAAGAIRSGNNNHLYSNKRRATILESGPQHGYYVRHPSSGGDTDGIGGGASDEEQFELKETRGPPGGRRDGAESKNGHFATVEAGVAVVQERSPYGFGRGRGADAGDDGSGSGSEDIILGNVAGQARRGIVQTTEIRVER